MGKKNHKGFSLVEMIVILAIMAIVTAGAGAMIYNYKSWNVSKCMQEIDVGLAEAKVDCMSKVSGGLLLSRGSDGCYYMKISSGEEEKISDEEVRIYYSDSDGHSDIEITDTKTLFISYNRATGAFEPIDTNAAGTSVYCKEIKITRAGRTVVITLEKTTGKHYLD